METAEKIKMLQDVINYFLEKSNRSLSPKVQDNIDTYTNSLVMELKNVVEKEAKS